MADAKIADIGKYHIVALVGEGAMGVVYKAVDSVLERTVAIKVMNESIARSEELRQRFLREAQAAASIQHPNVVSIYDLGESDGHLFIAMEFVPGADLEDLIESHAKLSLQAKLDIIIDVLTGLTYAHKRGIVHRDIKPANIRVAEDGRAKIMDFGVAHLASSNLTSTGASLGTPSYMAPEQITSGKVAPASDIFSVGAVLFELLTRTKPFDGATLQNLLFKIVTENPRRVTDLVPGLPSSLDRIVEKAMAKEMSARYDNALEMANELSIVRGELGGESYPTSVSLNARVSSAMRSSEISRERTRKIGFGGAGAVITAVLVVLAWWQTTKSHPGATSADTSAARTSTGGAAVTPAPPPREVAANPEPPATSKFPVDREAPAIAPHATPKDEKPAATASAARATPPKATPAPSAAPSATPVVSAPAPSVAVTQPPAAQPVVQQPVAPPKANVVSAGNAQRAPETLAAPAPATAADLAPVFDAYARAIESRDLAAIRRVYPGLTADQQHGFEQFFQSARKIDVTFRVANVESTGSSAEARLAGSYEYESVTGKVERTPVNFAATLRRDGSEWRLVSLR